MFYERTPIDKINDARRLFIIFSQFCVLRLFFPMKTVCHLYFEGAGRLSSVSFISSIGVQVIFNRLKKKYKNITTIWDGCIEK